MKPAPQRLRQAHDFLLHALGRGPQFVASCVSWAAEAGIAERTLREARRRLPITCERIGEGRGRPGWWRLEAPAPAPTEWRGCRWR